MERNWAWRAWRLIHWNRLDDSRPVRVIRRITSGVNFLWCHGAKRRNPDVVRLRYVKRDIDPGLYQYPDISWAGYNHGKTRCSDSHLLLRTPAISPPAVLSARTPKLFQMSWLTLKPFHHTDDLKQHSESTSTELTWPSVRPARSREYGHCPAIAVSWTMQEP